RSGLRSCRAWRRPRSTRTETLERRAASRSSSRTATPRLPGSGREAAWHTSRPGGGRRPAWFGGLPPRDQSPESRLPGPLQRTWSYLTALIVSVRVPEGTLTVTLSPFFLPTSARPTGESTEMRPADGSLSTAPTRWYVSVSPSWSVTSIVDPGPTMLE